MKEIVTRHFGPNNEFRMRAEKVSKDLVVIRGERYHDDCYGWSPAYPPMKVHRDEIAAAAKLLGL